MSPHFFKRIGVVKMTLSDKIVKNKMNLEGEGYFYLSIVDVRDCIKELKLKLFEDRELNIQDCKWSCGEINQIINDLVGDKLK